MEKPKKVVKIRANNPRVRILFFKFNLEKLLGKRKETEPVVVAAPKQMIEENPQGKKVVPNEALQPLKGALNKHPRSKSGKLFTIVTSCQQLEDLPQVMTLHTSWQIQAAQ